MLQESTYAPPSGSMVPEGKGEDDEGSSLPNIDSITRWHVGNEEFDLDSKFRVVDYLGQGAYGVVCAVFDETAQRTFAVKKCRDIFHSRTIAKRTLREIRLLSFLRHENIVKLISVQVPEDLCGFTDLYIIFERMDSDLTSVIKSNAVITDLHTQAFVHQILCGLEYLHSRHVYHRDLKPRNILVNSNCELRLADFGLSRIYSPGDEGRMAPMTEYVTTRWYRAPEILVGWKKYTAAVDIWAVGAILAELISRRPMLPGVDSIHQMDLIVDIFGKPDEAFIRECRKPSFQQQLREVDDVCPPHLSCRYPKASPAAIDFIYRVMELHPDARLTATQALAHCFVSEFKSPFIDPQFLISDPPQPLPSVEFLFERQKNSSASLRTELLKEVQRYHPEVKVSQLDISVATDIHIAPVNRSSAYTEELKKCSSCDVDTRKLLSGVTFETSCSCERAEKSLAIPEPHISVLQSGVLNEFVSFLDTDITHDVSTKRPPLYPAARGLSTWISSPAEENVLGKENEMAQVAAINRKHTSADSNFEDTKQIGQNNDSGRKNTDEDEGECLPFSKRRLGGKRSFVDATNVDVVGTNEHFSRGINESSGQSTVEHLRSQSGQRQAVVINEGNIFAPPITVAEAFYGRSPAFILQAQDGGTIHYGKRKVGIHNRTERSRSMGSQQRQSGLSNMTSVGDAELQRRRYSVGPMLSIAKNMPSGGSNTVEPAKNQGGCSVS